MIYSLEIVTCRTAILAERDSEGFHPFLWSQIVLEVSSPRCLFIFDVICVLYLWLHNLYGASASIECSSALWLAGSIYPLTPTHPSIIVRSTMKKLHLGAKHKAKSYKPFRNKNRRVSVSTDPDPTIHPVAHASHWPGFVIFKHLLATWISQCS